jgi:hypothetical protein
VPFKLEDEWIPEPFWIFLRREKSFCASRIKIPDCPARSEVTKPASLAVLPKWARRKYFHVTQAGVPPSYSWVC